MVDTNVYTEEGYDVTKVLITAAGDAVLRVHRDGSRYYYSVRMPDGSGKFAEQRSRDGAWAAAERALARLVEDIIGESCPTCGASFNDPRMTPGCEGCEEAAGEGLKKHPSDCDCDLCIAYWHEKRGEITP